MEAFRPIFYSKKDHRDNGLSGAIETPGKIAWKMLSPVRRLTLALR